MRRLVTVAVVVVASCGSVWSAEPTQLSVATLPPVVVKAVPQSGDTKVDSSTAEIRVIFSKKMMDRSVVVPNVRRVFSEDDGKAALPSRREDLCVAGGIGAGKDLRHLAELAEVWWVQGYKGTVGSPLSARLRD